MRERRTSPIISARLVLVVRREFLVLPMKEFAVLSCETPSGCFVVPAEAPWFRG